MFSTDSDSFKKYIITVLKMLGLYLDTLITCHTFGIMLSKLNVLLVTMQKELQHFMTNNVFWTKQKQQT